MEQQFSLSWNNFHGNLSRGFAGLLGNGEFVDVTIAVEGHLLQAHKVILSICSPYFKKMFQMNPCQHPIVVLRDVTHRAMTDLLQFMYHGEVSVKREDLTSFIGTAEVLQIKGLTNKQTDECVDSEQDSQKHSIETLNGTPDIDSYSSDPVEPKTTEDLPQNNEQDLLNQRQFLERLQRLSNLKRKSEEFLQKNYYTPDVFNFEKKQKKDKLYKQDSNIIPQINNYSQFSRVFDENPTEATNYSLHRKEDLPINMASKEENDPCKPVQASSDDKAEVKLECEDNDIEVTDPAVCITPKTYETSREGMKEQQEYHLQQNNPLSLLANGSEDQHLPVRYKYIYSRKGHKQLVHRNFVYTKHSTSHGKTAWRCVQYFTLNRCPATVETVDTLIYTINHQHNHEDCYEKLAKNNIYEMSDSK